jgi:hypothetical protein
MGDLLFLAVGYGVMVSSGKSVWSPIIDTGSFVVASSLILTQPKGSWPRQVGFLQFGVHLAQLLTTDKRS